jgi:hypothetical protein
MKKRANIEHRTPNIEHRIWEPLSVRLGLMPAGAWGGCIVLPDVFMFVTKILISSSV